MFSFVVSAILYLLKGFLLCFTGPLVLVVLVFSCTHRFPMRRRVALAGVGLTAVYSLVVVLPAVWGHIAFGNVDWRPQVTAWASSLPCVTATYLMSFECDGFSWLLIAALMTGLGKVSDRAKLDTVIRGVTLAAIVWILFNFSALITPLNSVLE